MKIARIILLLITTGSLQAQLPVTGFNIKSFGAAGDGKTLDTEAIQKAIEAASSAGGGTVFFPAGNYLSFSIRLKSNITLYLDNGCTLIAASPAENNGGYDAPEPNPWDKYQDFGHSHWHNSLIWGDSLDNISIVGQGRIYGKGLSRGRSGNGVGNKSIALRRCRNVILKDFSILLGGHFGILATGIDNFTIDNLKIDTNRDGIDIDCCKHVRISNCTVNSPYDDAICLKSSFALGEVRPTENVTITNCSVSGFDRGTFLTGTYKKEEANTVPDKGVVTGRIKFGTESNGGFKNITISNCTFEFCRGIALETVDGGILEDVTISNITMKDIRNAPIFLRLGARLRAPEGTVPGKLRRININNIIVYSTNPQFGSMIMGIPGHAIEDVKLSNIQILVKGGATREQASVQVPELEKSYPDPQEFGQIPAYGFFIRHVKGIEMSNVEIKFENDDFRSPFILEDVKDARFNNIKAGHLKDVPVFILKNVQEFSTHQCESVKDIMIREAEDKKL
jgi:polygalacturonase